MAKRDGFLKLATWRLRYAFGGRPVRVIRWCPGVLRLQHHPEESRSCELTFHENELDAIVSWVSAGASGPLPVWEYLERHWTEVYRWTGAARKTARAASLAQAVKWAWLRMRTDHTMSRAAIVTEAAKRFSVSEAEVSSGVLQRKAEIREKARWTRHRRRDG